MKPEVLNIRRVIIGNEESFLRKCDFVRIVVPEIANRNCHGIVF